MLSALASVFLLGIVPAEPPPPPPRTLPGIEVLDIAAPSSIAGTFVAPALSASGALLIDVLSGEEIFSVNADTRRPMASLTKIMTALLVLEHRSLNETVTIAPIADNIGGSSIYLSAGERFTVGSLMKALLIHSANDAAYALAVYDGRSVGGFVKMMNDRAAALGLKNTHFANPAGLDSEQQYATPRDLAWLTIAALKHEEFRDIVSTRTARISSFENRTIDLKNTNELLHYNQNVYGVKTGTTDRAGECLIVLFHENDHPYLLILLGSKERYTDSLRILKAVHDAA